MQAPLSDESAEQALQSVHAVAEEIASEPKYPALQPQCSVLFSLPIEQGPRAFEFGGQIAHVLD